MKYIKTFAAASALLVVSTGAYAHSISATGPTIDRAEAKIAAQAERAGMSYKITGAQMGNFVYMTAKLTPHDT